MSGGFVLHSRSEIPTMPFFSGLEPRGSLTCWRVACNTQACARVEWLSVESSAPFVSKLTAVKEPFICDVIG
jgi:hypothetical protein